MFISEDIIKSNPKFFESQIGKISGAITDPESERAENHAELYYEEIRHFTSDVYWISQHTDYTEEQVLMVKQYLFIDKHNLGGEFKRFDPDFCIAESWRRLAFDYKNIKPHDLTLIKHELLEINYIANGLDQRKAHEKAEKVYNYAIESREYYRFLQPQKRVVANDSIKDIHDHISGGISFNTEERY